MTHLEEYRYLIKHREVIVGEYLEKEIDRLCEDLQNSRYFYDTTEADKRIAFQEALCLQSKQPYYMKPIKLMPWQKAWWEALYSFRMESDKKRRFQEGLLVIARKNGKSSMFAADGNTDLFIGSGGADLCCASNDDRQCRLIWEELGGMRARLDPKNVTTRTNLTRHVNFKKNINVFRLSNKQKEKDGFNISKLYLDESHDLETDDLPEAGWRGMSSQDEPLFLNCTTEGFVNGKYLDKKIQHAKDVIDGIIDDERMISFLYLQDSEQEIWQDESSWEKSNPSIRYGVKKIDKLRRDLENAKTDKGARVHMLCKDFNIKQNSSEGWLTDSDYNYEQKIIDLEEWRGKFCLAAVDLAESTDLCNCKLLFMREGDPKKYVYSHYWIPESKLKESDDKAAGAEYVEWAKQGSLTIADGTMIDTTAIADWLYQLKDRYGIKVFVCGYDVRFSVEFIKRMTEYGIQTELVQQTAGVMSTPMKWVEADFKKQLIVYGDNAVDKWCFGNACMQMDNLGREMCVKPKGQHSKRIDGAVTLIILYATLQRYQSEFMKYW
jgi:phage terminase large subunit-like protein